jgi:hypothetical protein
MFMFCQQPWPNDPKVVIIPAPIYKLTVNIDHVCQEFDFCLSTTSGVAKQLYGSPSTAKRTTGGQKIIGWDNGHLKKETHVNDGQQKLWNPMKLVVKKFAPFFRSNFWNGKKINKNILVTKKGKWLYPWMSK